MNNKVLIAIATNSAGGAERAVSYIANFLSKYKYDVYLVNSDNDSSFYQISNSVNVIKLNCDKGNKYLKNIRLFFKIRSLISELRPKFALAFLIKMEVPVILNSMYYNIPVFTSVRNDPEVYDRFTNVFRKIFYPYVNGVVFQSLSASEHNSFNNLNKKVVIRNMLGEQYCNLNGIVSAENRRKKIISVGRLTQQKNQSLLIRAFAIVSKYFPDYTLEIYGTGEEETRLRELINDLKINEKIQLLGNCKDIILKCQDYSLFVLPSNYEGFPNVLVEAMACGIPVISTDFPSGVARELIVDDSYGFVIERDNVAKLAEKIIYVLSNSDRAQMMAINSLYVRDVLSPGLICKQWQDFIETNI